MRSASISRIVEPSPQGLMSSRLYARSTDTQRRHKSKKSEKLGRCGRQNMLRPYLKIWEWEWIFGHAVKAISSLGVRSPWNDWYENSDSQSWQTKISILIIYVFKICTHIHVSHYLFWFISFYFLLINLDHNANTILMVSCGFTFPSNKMSFDKAVKFGWGTKVY